MKVVKINWKLGEYFSGNSICKFGGSMNELCWEVDK